MPEPQAVETASRRGSSPGGRGLASLDLPPLGSPATGPVPSRRTPPRAVRRRSRLADAGIAVLVVLAVLSVAYVVSRPVPTVVAQGRAVGLDLPAPSPARTPVLLLAGAGAPQSHVQYAGQLLRWSLPPARPLPLTDARAALAGPELVVVQAAAGSPGPAVDAVRRLRAVAPARRLVLVGPLEAGGRTRERDVLRAAAVQSGAAFIDPVGSRWLTGPVDLVQADGELTPLGAQVVGGLLATALVRAERLQQTG